MDEMVLDFNFSKEFYWLTGHRPFPWQEKLFNEFLMRKDRKSCPVPTGLGKTSIMAIWLIALAHHVRSGTVADFPRRLAYVVNRRTVVDQSTDEAGRLRESLAKPELLHIADALRSLQTRNNPVLVSISTLRGQFADNAEWRDDPARPAIIIGTVDMIGSRLLFSGYGCGFKSRPLHAGFLGQDTLLVHDEAHLEPAFQTLVSSIEKEQERCHEFMKFSVMELTATSRSSGSNDDDSLLTEEDRRHAEVQKRIEAKKWLLCHQEDKIADKVIQLAKEYKDSGKAILVFLRLIDDVKKVADALSKTVSADNVEMLTGTLRGWERDKLAKMNAVFARFVRNSEAIRQQGTVYLVCTSAGEVGVNISADHLVCDLTPLDSMIQRFGRVNRFGDGDAKIDIVYRKLDAESKKSSKPSSYDQACVQTLSLLGQLQKREDDMRFDASPAALATIPAADRQAAFTPPPVILPATDILFDAWALTSVRQKLPGRPPVADWLHGIAEWELPVTYVAWREEVSRINTPVLLETYPPEDLLEDYPLKPHELLRDQTKRVFDELEKIAKRHTDQAAWLIDSDGKVEVFSLTKLVERNKLKQPLVNLADRTVLLPPVARGLNKGMLDGNETTDERHDIADEWTDEKNNPRRRRVWNAQDKPKGMRLVRTIDVKLDVETESDDEADMSSRRYWHWYVRPRSADDDGSRTARVKQELSVHLQSAEDFAGKLVTKLNLKEPEASAVIFAAHWHDPGKDRLTWQRSIGNHGYNPDDPRSILAKSGIGMKPLSLSNYRHEFGSLIDVTSQPEFLALAPDVKDLVLHLIAAHHGRARPHFSDQEAFDLERAEESASRIACEVPRRFALLQRKYGRWGLAYLESLVRAADIMASQTGNDADFDRPSETPMQGGDL
ncbi:MAG: type I-U CRISPR-associated helicase/endonuclease Cas3 [Nitrospirae bacterium]|nr:type I-U CRISPR-associated helicase/endonuclease Cas3 [Nitrospirota bacterium]